MSSNHHSYIAAEGPTFKKKNIFEFQGTVADAQD